MKKTNTDTKTSKFTTVNFVYARIAMILLAVNLCLTGYALTRISDTQGETSTTPMKKELVDTDTTDDPQAEGGE